MRLRKFIDKGLTVQFQKPGLPPGGPITPCLQAMAAIGSQGRPISPIGRDVARLFGTRRTLVVFVHTAGSGITPWRGLIVLDSDYKGQGQIRSPATIGLVAHELIHLLQRDLNQPHYWPSGGFRPSLRRLWVADSTNYMEVLAYLVGWTVEHDLTLHHASTEELSAAESEHATKVLKTLRSRIATLIGADSRNACRLVLKTYPDNPIYRSNYARENRLPDGRIPPGAWHVWLREIGFSRSAVDHIMVVAAQGQAEVIEELELI